MEVLIRPLNRGDIKQVVEIERVSFRDPWKEDAFYSELHNREISKFLVIELNGKIVGYGGMWIVEDEAHLVNLAIHPDHRRCGLGRRLLMALFDMAKKRGVERITLEVRASNTAAQAFYKKFGFQEIAIRKGYYRDTHEDAVVMWFNGLKEWCV